MYRFGLQVLSKAEERVNLWCDNIILSMISVIISFFGFFFFFNLEKKPTYLIRTKHLLKVF